LAEKRRHRNVPNRGSQNSQGTVPDAKNLKQARDANSGKKERPPQRKLKGGGPGCVTHNTWGGVTRLRQYFHEVCLTVVWRELTNSSAMRNSIPRGGKNGPVLKPHLAGLETAPRPAILSKLTHGSEKGEGPARGAANKKGQKRAKRIAAKLVAWDGKGIFDNSKTWITTKIQREN